MRDPIEARLRELELENVELRKALAYSNEQFEDAFGTLWLVLTKVGGSVRLNRVDLMKMPSRDHMVVSSWKDLNAMETVIEAKVSRTGQWHE